MTNKLLYVFSAIVLLMAIVAKTKTSNSVERPVMVSQNPVPACPPFCDPEPNTGPDTKTAKR